MTGCPPSARGRPRVLALVCACLALSGTASADDPWEFWPEAQLYVGLHPRTRLFLNAAYAKGKESRTRGRSTRRSTSTSRLCRSDRGGGGLPGQRTGSAAATSGRGWVTTVSSRPRGGPQPVGGGGPGDRLALGQVPVARRASGWRTARGPTCAGSAASTRRATAGGSRPRGSSSWSITRSFPTSTWSGSTTRATTAGRGRSTRRAPKVTVNKHLRFELNLSQQTDTSPRASRLNAFSGRGQGLLLSAGSRTQGRPTQDRRRASVCGPPGGPGAVRRCIRLSCGEGADATAQAFPLPPRAPRATRMLRGGARSGFETEPYDPVGSIDHPEGEGACRQARHVYRGPGRGSDRGVRASGGRLRVRAAPRPRAPGSRSSPRRRPHRARVSP